MSSRTDSLTHGDCGNQDMVTIAELCLRWNGSDTDLLLVINTLTFAVICDSTVWAICCVSLPADIASVS